MYKVIFFSICISFFSCTDPENVVIPSNVLPEEKMAAVMKDINLLEATMNVHVASVDKVGPDNSAIKMNIYTRNNITKEQFEESYKFYTENPDKMQEVYQLVLNDLSKMQATIVNAKK